MRDANPNQESSEEFSARDLIAGANRAAFAGAYQGVLSGAVTLMLVYGAAQAAVFVVGYLKARKAATP